MLSVEDSGLEIDLAANGWGAFLVRIQSRVFSVFVSGRVIERSASAWANRDVSLAEEVHGAHRLLHYSVSRTMDGWKVHNALSKATLALSDESASFQLFDPFGSAKINSFTLMLRWDFPAAAVGLQPPLTAPEALVANSAPAEPDAADEDVEAVPSEFVEESAPGHEAEPGLELPAEETPVALAEAVEDAVGLFNELTEPNLPQPAVPVSSTILEVESQANGFLRVELPIVLSDKEVKIFRHIARYGHVSREELAKVVKKRSATTASKLVDRLHEIGTPYIRIVEGQSYEFNYSH